MAVSSDTVKRRYIATAIEEYEYSWAPEYEKRVMTKRALSAGAVDIDPNAVDRVIVATDGAWIPAQVWVPKEWVKSKKTTPRRTKIRQKG